MIDFTLPEELDLTIKGLLEFLRREVAPLEQEHRELLENPHRMYCTDGRLSPEVLELRRRVRTTSARAGYFTLTTPEDVGGAGGGPLTLFLAWEALYHAAGGGQAYTVALALEAHSDHRADIGLVIDH